MSKDLPASHNGIGQETKLSSGQSPTAAERDALPSARTCETILLVEDDKGVRDIARVSLEDPGDKVVTAQDAVSGNRTGNRGH